MPHTGTTKTCRPHRTLSRPADDRIHHLLIMGTRMPWMPPKEPLPWGELNRVHQTLNIYILTWKDKIITSLPYGPLNRALNQSQTTPNPLIRKRLILVESLPNNVWKEMTHKLYQIAKNYHLFLLEIRESGVTPRFPNVKISYKSEYLFHKRNVTYS
jgi:hypothetical protein